MKIVHAKSAERSSRASSGESRSERIIFVLQALLIAASGFAALKGIADFFGITEHGILSPSSLVALIFAAFVVIVLTLAMWLAVEWAATPSRSIVSRIVLFGLYLVLLVWSVGFGYGFWWSVLAAPSATSTAITTWVGELKNNIADADGQLTGVLTEIERMRVEAVKLKNLEQTVGGTCGRNDGAGCKQLCTMRISITNRLENVAATVQDDWLKKLKGDLGAFGSNVREQIEILGAKPENEQRRGLIEIRERGNAEQTRFNSFSRQRSQTLSADLGAVATALNIPPNARGFSCYNPEQAASIQRVVETLKHPPELKIGNFAIFLGNDATRVAILKLWQFVASSLTGQELNLMRPTGLEASAMSTGLRGNDWIALMATCLVDLAILVFAWFKPRPAFSSQAAAKKWLDENLTGRERDFMNWYSGYRSDRRGSLYIVRPTPFWTRAGKPREGDLSVDQIVNVALPLVSKKLIKEVRPNRQLLTTAQQVLQTKNWTVESQDAPATVYRVIGGGMAQLYAAARGEPAPRRSSFFRGSETPTTPPPSPDRGPGR